MIITELPLKSSKCIYMYIGPNCHNFHWHQLHHVHVHTCKLHAVRQEIKWWHVLTSASLSSLSDMRGTSHVSQPHPLISKSPSPSSPTSPKHSNFSDISSAGCRDEKATRRSLVKSGFHCLKFTLVKCQPQVCQILRSTNHYEKVMMTIHSKIKLLYFLKIKNLGPIQKIFIALIVTSIRVHHNFIGC